MPKSNDLIYAIDYGTSNSLLAAAGPEGTIPPIALDPLASDPTILRSVLYFPHMNEVHFGSKAVQEFAQRDMEGRLIRSIKKYLPIRSFIGTWVGDRPVNIEDIIGIFLGEIRRRANNYFQADVDHVVLGRPAKFAVDPADDAYAQYRLERSARNAGFKHIEFCAEPLAAAFGFKANLRESKRVLVADFGGGTSDFTVIRIGSGEYRPEDVLAIGGVSVAGDAFDSAMMRQRISKHFGANVEYMVPFGSNTLKMPVQLMDKICSPADIVLLRQRDTMEFFKNVRQWSLGGDDQKKMDQLFCLIEDQLGFSVFEKIEQTKRKLSESDRALFRFTYPGVDVSEEITRFDFDEFSAEKVEQITCSLDETVKEAGLHFKDIDIVVCTGGTAKVPVLQNELIARFGREKIMQHNNFHSVVEGLAERAKMLF